MKPGAPMAETIRIVGECACRNVEDGARLGFRCCECGAFYALRLPIGRAQFCPCGHTYGTLRVEFPKVKVRGWDRILARLKSAFDEGSDG